MNLNLYVFKLSLVCQDDVSIDRRMIFQILYCNLKCLGVIINMVRNFKLSNNDKQLLNTLYLLIKAVSIELMRYLTLFTSIRFQMTSICVLCKLCDTDLIPHVTSKVAYKKLESKT